MAVTFLIILVVTLIYFIVINKEEDSQKNINIERKELSIFNDPNEEGELLDLKAITQKLENSGDKPIMMNNYEEEQENRAIISYDELLEKQKDLKINYENEQQIGDLTIKKVNVDNISSPKEERKMVTVIGYEKEEAFLEALKKLQEQIN